MNTLKLLISQICSNFSLHLARKETISAILYGMMMLGNVQHQSFARFLNIAKPQNAVRRIERFFAQVTLSCAESALTMVDFLGFKGKFRLCLDRTNWKFGEKNINYLVLSWLINKKVSLPLFAIELDKAGNSNTSERIEILEMFENTFGLDRIEFLLADREFVGDTWFRKLIEWKVPFYIRVKDNSLVPFGDDPIHLKALFDHLKPNEYRLIEKEMHGSTVYYAGTRAALGDLVIVVSNQDIKAQKILNNYRKRWSIEEMFRKMKTSGFNWEGTHMTISTRLMTLFILMSLATLLVYCMGLHTKIPWKKTINYPLRSLFRQGMVNFQHRAAKGLECAWKFILESLARVKEILLFC